MKATILQQLKQGLVVSCQAYKNEPLRDSYIMSRMALAAQVGGAIGIRANGVEDILAIKKEVDLPIIGIFKQKYPDSPIYITPTFQEVSALASVGVEIVAIDATLQKRPFSETLDELVKQIREAFPNLVLMADISALDEAKNAERLGFDLISTTLVGYTEKTEGQKIYHNDFAIVEEFISTLQTPVVVEGNVLTPEHARRCFELGAYSIVVGGAITRPQQITQRFVDEINLK